MRLIKTPFLAFILLLATFGVCLGDKILEERFEALVIKYQALYILEGQIIGSIEEVTPQAVEALEKAQKVMASKKPEKATKDDRIIILTAAYLEEKLKRLYCQLGLVHWEMNAVEEEAYNIRKQLKSERRA